VTELSLLCGRLGYNDHRPTHEKLNRVVRRRQYVIPNPVHALSTQINQLAVQIAAAATDRLTSVSVKRPQALLPQPLPLPPPYRMATDR